VSCWKLNWLVSKERYLYPSIAYTYPTSLIGWVVIKARLEPTVRLRSDQIVDSWTVTFKVSFQEVRFPGILEFRDRCRRFRRRSTISRLLCCCTMHTAQDRADDTALFCRSAPIRLDDSGYFLWCVCYAHVLAITSLCHL
jgi:hypothetical protein